ncbi:Tfp pilus assembly protein PilN [Salibacterium salarium]|uniref:hypothetical protein n=1 Tax=Salibacterium salarium TaxID=284579 RepID=UPI002786318E|nr:hypothetical protein [Salibacterium salarium]MDQ0298682.1 Tfp pilus assembly protein PilN [Salibacterium salarium]
MIADINLLPEKEKKDGTWLVVFSVLLVLLVMVYVSTQFMIAKEEEAVATLEEEQQALSSEIQAEQSRQGEEGEIADLQQAANTIHNTIVPASSLLERMTASLPDGGYITAIDYAYPSLLNVTVQVNEVNEAADLQHTLQEEESFSNVSMVSVNYSDPLEENPERFHEEERIPRYKAVFEMNVEGRELRQSGEQYES